MSDAKKVIMVGGESKFALRKKKEFMLSEESALEQVMTLLEYYDIDVDAMPKIQGVNPVEGALTQLVKFVRQGRVEISRGEDNKLTVQFTLTGGSEAMVFTELNAKHKLAMDRGTEKGNYNKIYALMSSMAGLPVDAISKLDAKDLSVIEVLGMVFLAV